jgi:hypothetical protein
MPTGCDQCAPACDHRGQTPDLARRSPAKRQQTSRTRGGERSTELNLHAATLGPTQVGRKVVLTKRVVAAAETQRQDDEGWHVVDKGVGDGVLLLHGQEHDMRNPRGH